MHNERCTSGSEGGHQNPTAVMPHGADARPYSPINSAMEGDFVRSPSWISTRAKAWPSKQARV
jgi:hypothetical protein